MTHRHFCIVTGIFLTLGISAVAASAAEPGGSRCGHSLAQYSEYAQRLQPLADRARVQADENPLYESDAQFYAAELNDAQQCIRNLTPTATASR